MTPTPASPLPPAVAGEGEPQTDFLLPQEGGSYVRNPDGSLTKVSGPNVTAPKE